jgi:HEPN domain-containing protein
MIGKRKTEARRWFQQAYYDLKATRWNIEGGFYDTACFIAQQAAEKALKSILYFTGSRRKALMTHSTVEMVREAGKKINSLVELINEARELDLHYIPSRYPNGIPSGYPHQFYGRKNADQALTAAEKIFNAIKDYYLSGEHEDIIESDEKL